MTSSSRLSIRLTRFAAFLSVVALAGCGGGGGSSPPPIPAGTGTLGVSLTDTPACGFDAVNVTVSKVRVHQSQSAPDNDAGWSEIVLNPPKKINLLNLTNGAFESLGQVPLSVGHYTQIRLVLVENTATSTANSVILPGTTAEIPLSTPSAVQSGIKLINEFDVASGQRVDLMLDFDACKSVVARGNGSYALKPVVKVIPTVLNGIDGYVTTALLASNVTVTAQVNGTVVRSTVPDPQTGEFFLARLESGADKKYDVVITADNRATVVIAAVPVMTATEVVLVATNALPITMLPSTTHTITGNVTLNPSNPDEVAAYVAAKQTLGGGTTVTVQSRAANLLTGDYTLVLPVVAPQLGQYGSGTLPIALVNQPAAAGKYAVEATATGFTPQAFDKNIALGDATQNFALVAAP